MTTFLIDCAPQLVGKVLPKIQSVSSQPLFSVVISTYGRDDFILPTLESVANQDLNDFEVLVVNDGPPSEKLKEIVENFDDRFTLHELPSRSRSQAGPNNLGWEKARGKYIAYLGHDDIWSSDHLSSLVTSFERNKSVDFVVSGCIYLGPTGTDDMFTWVTGLFDINDRNAASKYFFPPSSFSHKRWLNSYLPKWSEPMTTRRPVDTEFMIGAFERGCNFMSTGKITVFKFASALRYLSYLLPDDNEQREILKLMEDNDLFEKFITERVNCSIKNGGYMAPKHAPIDMFMPGQKIIENEVVRGIKLPQISKLKKFQEFGTENDLRGFDWYPTEQLGEKKFRWSGPNHRPRLLIPYCHEGPVYFVIRILEFASEEIKNSLKIILNGIQVNFESKTFKSESKMSFTSTLNVDRLSIMEFQMSHTIRRNSADIRKIGFCLKSIELYSIE